MWVYCCDCGHERDVNRAMVLLPAEAPVPEVGKHMKCSACGSRKINTKPDCTLAVSPRCVGGTFEAAAYRGGSALSFSPSSISANFSFSHFADL